MSPKSIYILDMKLEFEIDEHDLTNPCKCLIEGWPDGIFKTICHRIKVSLQTEEPHLGGTFYAAI